VCIILLSWHHHAPRRAAHAHTSPPRSQHGARAPRRRLNAGARCADNRRSMHQRHLRVAAMTRRAVYITLIAWYLFSYLLRSSRASRSAASARRSPRNSAYHRAAVSCASRSLAISTIMNIALTNRLNIWINVTYQQP